MLNNIQNTEIPRGVDAKLLQYDINTIPEQIKKRCSFLLENKFAEDTCCINLNDSLSKLFAKPVDQNIIMINIEKDTTRYFDTIEEFKKLSITKFQHLRATYWKKRTQLIEDLNYVIKFLVMLKNMFNYY